MTYTKIGKVWEVPRGAVRPYFVAGKEVIVCHTAQGMYAVDNICSHEEGSLYMGELKGCEIECPLHGAKFDVRNGKVMCGPALRPISAFPVRVSGEDIEIDI